MKIKYVCADCNTKVERYANGMAICPKCNKLSPKIKEVRK